MADNTKIEWSNATWNVVTGCTEVSPGCDHCYARTFAERWRGTPGHHFENGFDLQLRPERLHIPLSWKKPRKVFVNSMSDLFHKDVPDDYIARTFATMALTPQHTYQLLSKRHARMHSLLSSLTFQNQVAQAIDALRVDQEHAPEESWADIPGFTGYQASTHGNVRGPQGQLATCPNPRSGRPTVTRWHSGDPKTQFVHRLVLMAHQPTEDASLEVCHRNGDKTDNRLANLRWGTRSENQREKVRHGSRGGPQKLSAATAALIRSACQTGRRQQAVADEFGVSRSLVSLIAAGRAWAPPDLQWPLPNVHLGVSVENQKWADIRIKHLMQTPAAVRFLSLEPLIGPVRLHRGHAYCPTHDFPGGFCTGPCPDLILPNWIIIGGESGSGARPFNPQWAADLIDDARQAGAAPFVKQLGSAWARDTTYAGKTVAAHGDPKGGNPDYWPAHLRVREYPTAATHA